MQYFAQRYNWRLSWMADEGKKSGETLPGNTGWRALPGTDNVIYVDVSTSKSEFQRRPSYVTALHGGDHHWKALGVHAIYEHLQRSSFRRRRLVNFRLERRHVGRVRVL